MSVAPEEVPSKLSTLTGRMHLERGGTVQFVRIDKVKNIWSLRIKRNDIFLKFSDWNRSEELLVRGVDIRKVAATISLLATCRVKKQEQIEDHVRHYMIIVVQNEEKGEEKEEGEEVA